MTTVKNGLRSPLTSALLLLVGYTMTVMTAPEELPNGIRATNK